MIIELQINNWTGNTTDVSYTDCNKKNEFSISFFGNNLILKYFPLDQSFASLAL
jgi:hypothetical protein